MEKNNIAKQTMILTVLVTITGFFGITMPIVAIAYPIILTFIGLKNGLVKSITAFITSVIVIAIISQSFAVIVIPIQYGILSIVTVYMVNKRYKMEKIIIYGAATVFIMVLLHMGLNWYIRGINTFIELENSLTIMTTEQLRLLSAENMSESDISQFANIARSMKDYIVTIIPVLLMMSSLAISYLNYYVASRLVRGSDRNELEVPEFSKIILPTHVITGLGTMIVLSYALKFFGDFNYQGILDNIFVLIIVAFLVEGLSLTIYLINKMKIGKFVKTFFIAIVVLSSFFNIVLVSVGIMDIVLDFRKLRKKQIQ